MDAKEIIERAGGTSRVARLCNTTPQAVTNWKARGIPYRALLQFPEVFASALAGLVCAESKSEKQPST